MIKAGKIRHIAASNVAPERLKKSFDVADKNGFAKYVALQPHYNLLEGTQYETEYLPLIEKYGLTVFPYWSLAAGFLTGKYRTEADLNKSIRGSGVEKYLNEKELNVLNLLDEISAKLNSQLATVSCIHWLLAQPHISAPIVSATSLDTLFAAPNLKLDVSDLELLDRMSK